MDNKTIITIRCVPCKLLKYKLDETMPLSINIDDMQYS